MSAMDKFLETALKAVMSASGVDMEDVKKEVTSRVEKFENNINLLNSTLVSILENQQRQERNLKILMEHHSLIYDARPEYPPTANQNGDANHADTRNSVPSIAGLIARS